MSWMSPEKSEILDMSYAALYLTLWTTSARWYGDILLCRCCREGWSRLADRWQNKTLLNMNDQTEDGILNLPSIICLRPSTTIRSFRSNALHILKSAMSQSAVKAMWLPYTNSNKSIWLMIILNINIMHVRASKTSKFNWNISSMMLTQSCTQYFYLLRIHSDKNILIRQCTVKNDGKFNGKGLNMLQ